MAINIAWDNPEKTILVLTFEPHWTWNLFYGALDRAGQYLAEVDHPTGIILDLQHWVLVPDGVLGQGRKLLTYPRHKNYGLTVAVGTNRFVQALGNTVRKLYKIPNSYEFIFASTLTEARDILNRHMQQSTMEIHE